MPHTGDRPSPPLEPPLIATFPAILFFLRYSLEEINEGSDRPLLQRYSRSRDEVIENVHLFQVNSLRGK